jgi:hypothetical protein
MFGAMTIIVASVAAIWGVGGRRLLRWLAQIRGAPLGSFEERVRRRAYLLWKAEGCPPDRAEQNWQSAEAIESATGAGRDDDDSLSSDIEQLQFRSDLAEVQLLLDFISGRPDKAFTWRRDAKGGHCAPSASLAANPANSSATALAHAITSDHVTPEELRQIATIRFPPNKTLEANAEDAALLIAVRDKLNQLVRPASGLTIAFTLGTWAPWRMSSRRGSRQWARWKLAAAAHPQLRYATFRFRLSAYAFSILALVVTLATVWLSNEVADGTPKLHRVQALDQKQSAMVEEIWKIEGIKAAPNAIDPRQKPRNQRPVVYSGNGATADQPFVVRYCEKPRLSQPVTDIARGVPVEIFDSAQQYETCDNYARLTSELRAAQIDLALWWTDRTHSPLVVGRCRLEQWLGGDSAECTAFDRPLPERSPLVLARLGSPMPSATPEPESADDQAAPYFPDDIADMLASLSNIWLPMMYGISGAIVAALRTIYRKVSASTLAPWDTRLLWTRMVLGMIAGSCVGLFFSPAGTGVQGNASIGTLSLSAIAFLAGYAVDGLFGLLDEIVRRIFKTEQEGSETGR